VESQRTRYLNKKDWTNKDDGAAGGALLKWWSGLEERRGQRALLRRAQGAEPVAFIPSYHGLYHALTRRGYGSIEPERLAMVAGLASHVRTHLSQHTFAYQLAPRDNKGLSDLRMRRLLAIEQDDDLLYQHLRRAIALCRGELNLLDLAHSVYNWDTRVRKDWAYAYYEFVNSQSES
jgi:CRISPR system Cascade subunit CasB